MSPRREETAIDHFRLYGSISHLFLAAHSEHIGHTFAGSATNEKMCDRSSQEHELQSNNVSKRLHDRRNTYDGEERACESSFEQLAPVFSWNIVVVLDVAAGTIVATWLVGGRSVDNGNGHHSSDEQDVEDNRKQREEGESRCTAGDKTPHKSVCHGNRADGYGREVPPSKIMGLCREP